MQSSPKPLQVISVLGVLAHATGTFQQEIADRPMSRIPAVLNGIITFIAYST